MKVTELGIISEVKLPPALLIKCTRTRARTSLRIFGLQSFWGQRTWKATADLRYVTEFLRLHLFCTGFRFFCTRALRGLQKATNGADNIYFCKIQELHRALRVKQKVKKNTCFWSKISLRARKRQKRLMYACSRQTLRLRDSQLCTRYLPEFFFRKKEC